MTDTNAVLGYAWPLVVSPGEAVTFQLSSATLDQAEATVMRVRCADPDPAGPGLKLTEPGSAVDGTVALIEQKLHPGSCLVVPDQPALSGFAAFSVGAFVWPTMPGAGAQTIIARWQDAGGWRFGLDAEGRPEFVIAQGGKQWSAHGETPLLAREWVLIGASWDPGANRMRVFVRSLDTQAGRDRTGVVEADAPGEIVWPTATTLTMAAHPKPSPSGRGQGEGRHVAPIPFDGRHPHPNPLPEGEGDPTGPYEFTAFFDGKIDRPRLYAAALGIDALHRLCDTLRPSPSDPALIGAWDFSIGIPTEHVHDHSANRLDGALHQLPTRGMTGADWDGSTERWTETPSQYGAIHFHSDDMADAGWTPTLRLTVPDDWRSGFYALRLRARTGEADPVESYVGFFIRAPLGKPQSRLAFVASTATFLAYANSALRLDQVHAEVMLEGLLALSRDDAYIQEHREVGLSTYDTHSDGSGWCLSSARRPILSMRPRGAVFNYGNDTHLIDWLEHIGQDYDIVADDDIHRHGVQALRPYACVITGSHPEYISREMLDAFDAYASGGGRHMYLGGNGFYWRIGYHPTVPHTMEIRRGMNGLRTWEGEAGENAMQFTGEPSGLWRSNGRPPQRLVGVGFDAQVFTHSSPYRWLDGAHAPALRWLTEGIDLSAPLGDFGLRGGGAAGIEVDRVEPTLGSPPGLVWLATADQLGYGGLPSPEEMRTLYRGFTGDQNAQVRADIVFFPTAQGGAMFSTGSIAYVCALSCHGYENNVSRLTGNVLRRFLDPAAFDGQVTMP